MAPARHLSAAASPARPRCRVAGPARRRVAVPAPAAAASSAAAPGVLESARLVAGGEASARELAEQCLRRIEAEDGGIRAFLSVSAEQVRSAQDNAVHSAAAGRRRAS